MHIPISNLRIIPQSADGQTLVQEKVSSVWEVTGES